jgi:hypothetical protein
MYLSSAILNIPSRKTFYDSTAQKDAPAREGPSSLCSVGVQKFEIKPQPENSQAQFSPVAIQLEADSNRMDRDCQDKEETLTLSFYPDALSLHPVNSFRRA